MADSGDVYLQEVDSNDPRVKSVTDLVINQLYLINEVPIDYAISAMLKTIAYLIYVQNGAGFADTGSKLVAQAIKGYIENHQRAFCDLPQAEVQAAIYN